MKSNYKFWSYTQLGTKLKHWSFESKMLLAHNASAQLVKPESVNPEVLRYLPQPEEIETFIMLAIKNDEWQDHTMKTTDFEQAISAIRSFKHPKWEEHKGKDFGNWFLMLTSANQFEYQSNKIFKANRYLTYFTHVDDHINMCEVFRDKFGVDYRDIAGPMMLLWISYSSDEMRLSKEQWDWLVQNYKDTIALLTLTREEYIKELDEITYDPSDYKYCLRPSYSWPFINHEGIVYLPTPHLLVRAVTESLMHRLTFGNNSLREKIGLHVLEPYLYSIVAGSDEFQAVLPEQTYDDKKKTLDVLTNIDGNIVCFDSKSCVPLIGIRIFSMEAYEKTKLKIAKAVVQAYKHIHDRFGKDYMYLSVPVTEDRSNIFAIVVLAENPFCPLGDIYGAAAEQLGIDKTTKEYDWLRGHVGVVGLDALEVQLFLRKNFMEVITENIRTGRFDDHWMLQGELSRADSDTNYIDDNVSGLIHQIAEKMNEQIGNK